MWLLTIFPAPLPDPWQEVWYRFPHRAEYCTVPYPLHRHWLWVSVSTQKRRCLCRHYRLSKNHIWGPVYALRHDKATTVALLLSRSWGKDLNAKDRTCRKWASINLEESSPLASFQKVVADFWACYQGRKVLCELQLTWQVSNWVTNLAKITNVR